MSPEISLPESFALVGDPFPGESVAAMDAPASCLENEHSHAARPGSWSFEHFVQFYESDSFLVQSVARFLGAALGAGEGAISIATGEHRTAIEQRLAGQGINVSFVKERGQFISLDASEVLAEFMIGDQPDEILFQG